MRDLKSGGDFKKQETGDRRQNPESGILNSIILTPVFCLLNSKRLCTLLLYTMWIKKGVERC